MKKSLLSVALGVLLFTSNAHAGIPVVDGTSIQQSITNFIQNMNQNLKDYAIQAKNYALQAKQFVQEQTKGISDVIGAVNEGKRWLEEQESKMKNALKDVAHIAFDPVSGEMQDQTLSEFTKKLRTGEETYNKTVNALVESKRPYEDVVNTVSSLDKDVKAYYEKLFGKISTEHVTNVCKYNGSKINNCALEIGNRLSYVKGLQQIEKNIKAIEAKSQYGLLKVAAKESNKTFTTTQKESSLLVKAGSSTVTGTTDKQQLEANNIIADAGIAMQKQIFDAQQMEAAFKKREEIYSKAKITEIRVKRNADNNESYLKNLEESKKYLDKVSKEIYGK